jgi:POLQ-like helicase
MLAWQDECLTDARLCAGQNLVINLPTGGGKTLIAEILMLRQTLVCNRNALLILPFVAIVQEKVFNSNQIFANCIDL